MDKIEYKQPVTDRPRLVDMLEFDRQLLAHQQVGEPSKLGPDKLVVNLRSIG